MVTQKRCARKEQSLLSVYVYREQLQIGFLFSEKTYFPPCVCATCSDIPTNISTMLLDKNMKDKGSYFNGKNMQ